MSQKCPPLWSLTVIRFPSPPLPEQLLRVCRADPPALPRSAGPAPLPRLQPAHRGEQDDRPHGAHQQAQPHPPPADNDSAGLQHQLRWHGAPQVLN